MNREEYLALSEEREKEAKGLALKALDGQLPPGYIWSDNPDQMYGNAMFRIKPESVVPGSMSIHFIHRLMHRTDRDEGDLVTTPTTETVTAYCDIFNGRAWETNSEWGVDGKVVSTLLSQADLVFSVRDVVSMALSQKPFVSFEWKRDEHDSHKHHLFACTEKYGSVWKSGSMWGTTIGIPCETLGNAKVRTEGAAMGWIKTRHDERLAGLGEIVMSKEPYDRNNMDAAIEYSKETNRLFRSGDMDAAFAHYMRDPNGGALMSFKDTNKDEFVVGMQSMAGGPLAAIHLSSNERQSWCEAGAGDDEIEAIAQMGGYAAIRKSGPKLLALQDLLDHVMEARYIGVRNELRKMGWEGEGQALEKVLGDVSLRARLVCVNAGAGRNVVDFQFDVIDVSKPVYSTTVVDNDMNKCIKAMAAEVNSASLVIAVQASVAAPGETSRIGPSFNIGQRFEFKAGDPIVGNGYRGSVTKVCDGQLAGMVEVRLPGGYGCLSSSYPECYPAIQNGVEVVTDGRHVGKVEEVTSQFVIQDAGRGKMIAHEVGKFDVLPQLGEKVDVQYRGDKAVVVEPKAKVKGNER